jgi:hypothetical protein
VRPFVVGGGIVTTDQRKEGRTFPAVCKAAPTRKMRGFAAFGVVLCGEEKKPSPGGRVRRDLPCLHLGRRTNATAPENSSLIKRLYWRCFPLSTAAPTDNLPMNIATPQGSAIVVRFTALTCNAEKFSETKNRD